MHKHHVTPKHRDPASQVTVTVSPTCHAMFHWCEWKLWGHWQDVVAWRGLAGLASSQESSLRAQSEGGKKGGRLGKPPMRDDLLAQAQIIAQDYLDGASTRSLRKKYKCGQGSLLFVLKKVGVEMRSKGHQYGPQKPMVISTVTCPHCGKQGGANVMYRWHFDNCRVKLT